MKTLLIVAGLFFVIVGGVIGYFAASGPGHEYDLKYVLPIDAHQMPKFQAAPAVQSWSASEEDAVSVQDGRAEAGKAPPLPDRPPVTFDERPGTASEGQIKDDGRR